MAPQRFELLPVIQTGKIVRRYRLFDRHRRARFLSLGSRRGVADETAQRCVHGPGDRAQAKDILADISNGHQVLAPKDRGAFSRFSERHQTAPIASCLATQARSIHGTINSLAP